MFDLAPLKLSLGIASLATVLIVAVGLPLARWLARARFAGRGFLSGVLALPLVLPPTVLGFYLLQLLGRRGPVGMWLERQFEVIVVFHWTGAVIASAVAAFPLFYLPARSAFAGVDPELENVARLLGRGEWSIFTTVTIPLAWRGLAAGTMLAFVRSLGDFGATLMVGGDIPGRTRTAAIAIYDSNQAGRFAEAAAMTVAISLVSIAALVIVQRLEPRRAR
jgi:molybdate transport system permease protein